MGDEAGGLIVGERPRMRARYMVAAFAGWPDAADASTDALNYLGRMTGSYQYAEIDPEPYFVLTDVRPLTSVDDSGRRYIHWPETSLSYSDPERGEPHMIYLMGIEPNMRWRPFTEVVLSEADRFGIEVIVTLGSLMDAVPHSRETRITGVATAQEHVARLRHLGIAESGYEGPAGIHTALLEACESRGVAYVSLWAHSPHYVTTSPNPKATLALLMALRDVLDPTMLLDNELGELRRASSVWETEVERAISSERELALYVKTLERRFDDQAPTEGGGGTIPSPEAMVAELEEFLRSRRGGTE